MGFERNELRSVLRLLSDAPRRGYIIGVFEVVGKLDAPFGLPIIPSPGGGRSPVAPSPRPHLRVVGGGGGSPPWGGCGSAGGAKMLSFS